MRVLLIFLAAALQLSAACVASGQVSAVHDGDTFTVWIQERPAGCKPDVAGVVHLRIAHIDAPELDQNYGRASLTLLDRAINGKTVRFRITGRSYDRLVADDICVTGGEMDLAKWEVLQGIAWHYAPPSLLAKWFKVMPARDRELAAAQKTAQENQQGLWTSARGKPVAPWIWRAERKR